MRVLHLYSSFHPRRGGVPPAVAALAKAQRRAGADARLVSVDGQDEPEVRQFLAAGGYDGIPLTRLPGLRRGMRALPVPSLDAWRVLDGVDLLHIHGVWEPLGLMLSLVARARSIPYVVAPHGMLADWSLGHRPTRKRVALRAGYGDMLRHAAFLHFLNEPERDGVPRWVPLPARSEIIPNGVFAEVFAALPPRGAFRAELPQVADHPMVLFLGRLHLQKGLLTLAEAFARLAKERPDVRLVVAGPDQGGRAATEARLSELGMRDRAHFTGPLYGEAKWRALVDADVFCLPSYQEAFSVAITEALGAGLPCVVSRESHYPLITEIGAGAVVEREPEAVADALARVLSEDAEREAMGRRAADYVRAHLTWECVAERSLDLYGTVCR